MLIKLKYRKVAYEEMPAIEEIIINTHYIKRMQIFPSGKVLIRYDEDGGWWMECVDKWEDIKHKFEIK